MRTVRLTITAANLFAALLLATSGCAATAGGSDDLAVALDLAVPVDAAAPPDQTVAPPGDLAGPWCNAQAPFAVYQGVRVDPVAVTSSRLVLDCCEGAALRFHLERQAGAPVALVVRELGGALPAGRFALDHLPDRLQASLLVGTTPQAATLIGDLIVEPGARLEDPLLLSVCARVEAKGQPIDGAELGAWRAPVMAVTAEGRVRIQLLTDRSIGARAAQQAPIDSLVLDDTPLADLYTLGWYRRATHAFFWDNYGTTAALRNRVGAVPTRGTPFVVTVDGKRRFVGAFFSLVSSDSFAGPVVVMEALTDAGFALAAGYPPVVLQPDPRDDPALLATLAAVGKLE